MDYRRYGGAIVSKAAQAAQFMFASAADPFFANTVLLCHCDGANGDVNTPNIAFAGPTPLTGATGHAVLSTTKAKFGSTSIRVPGGATDSMSNNASSASWAFGTGAFTIEFWLNLDSLAAVNVFDMRPNSNGNFATIGVNNTSGSVFYFVNPSFRITSANGAVTTNAWQFWAYSKQAGSGGTGELSINGTVVGSWSDTITYANASVIDLVGDQMAETAPVFRRLALPDTWTKFE